MMASSTHEVLVVVQRASGTAFQGEAVHHSAVTKEQCDLSEIRDKRKSTMRWGRGGGRGGALG